VDTVPVPFVVPMPQAAQTVLVVAMPVMALTSLPLAVTNHGATANIGFVAMGTVGSRLFAVLPAYVAYVVTLSVRKAWTRPIEASPARGECERSFTNRDETAGAR